MQGNKGLLTSAVIVPLFMAGWILWGFGYETVWARLSTDVERVVVSSRDAPSKGAPRYVTEYVIRTEDGRFQSYVASPTDASLARSLPIGARIKKEWGSLSYEVNGNRISFPLAFYSAMFGVALFCLVWAGLQWRNSV